MKTVLVSGASGVVGYGALKNLRASGYDLKLIGTTIYENSVAPLFCDVFEKAPKTNEECYIPWLCEIIKKHNVDMIVPGIEGDVAKWSANRHTLAETGAFVLVNNHDLINLCADKWLFYQKIAEHNIPCAITSRIDDDFDDTVRQFGLPFIMKPRHGSASKAVTKIVNLTEYRKVKDEYGDEIMAQELVGSDDEEYTVSGFFDNNSELCACMALSRKLAKEGYTGQAEVCSAEPFKNTVKQLAEVLKPVGPTNFQFRKDKDGNMKLLEINPRVSSATSIRAAFGYNELKLSLEYFLYGKNPQQPVLRKGRAVRYAEDYICYED
jgi:carbamoyl-phosphate synthase large subunit